MDKQKYCIWIVLASVTLAAALTGDLADTDADMCPVWSVAPNTTLKR